MRTYLDGYCERTDGSVWSEPLNAVSNVSFLVAAVVVWSQVRRLAAEFGRMPLALLALPVLITGVGIGSALFHTTATTWGLALDNGAIALFVLWFVVLWVHMHLGIRWRWAWLAAPAFLAYAAVVTVTLRGLPGLYLAVVIALAVVAAVLARSPETRPQAWRYAAATVVFAASLTARTLDGPICASVPIGTHFLWHVLNGVVVLLASQAAILRWRQLVGQRSGLEG